MFSQEIPWKFIGNGKPRFFLTPKYRGFWYFFIRFGRNAVGQTNRNSPALQLPSCAIDVAGVIPIVQERRQVPGLVAIASLVGFNLSSPSIPFLWLRSNSYDNLWSSSNISFASPNENITITYYYHLLPISLYRLVKSTFLPIIWNHGAAMRRRWIFRVIFSQVHRSNTPMVNGTQWLCADPFTPYDFPRFRGRGIN